MHHNTKNLIGKTFNNLTVVRIAERNEHIPTKRRGTFWLCKCECGNEKIVMSTELTRGDTKSCGCGNKFEKSHNYKGVGKLSQSKFSHIKWGAIKRGLEFSITKEYAWELYQNQEGKCFYTQLPIELNTKNNGMTASIDRVDSKKGYIEGNIVWVHKDINIMKNVFSKQHFLMLCKKVVENHK